MEVLHYKDIIHRDLKLENIMMGDSFLPKILDFGMARTLKEGRMTQGALGTFAYIAPEILEDS